MRDRLVKNITQLDDQTAISLLMPQSRNPLRVGLDLASVKAVEDSIGQHGRHYLERVYTERELDDCKVQLEPDPERLAARFAAKEATMKVLRPADDTVLPWTAIEIRRGSGGSIQVELNGEAAALASAAGVESLSLSITHESDFAAAVVVAEMTGLEGEQVG